MRVAVIGGFAPSLVNFRGELLRELVALGHQVRAFAPEQDDAVIARLAKLGASFEQVPLVRTGLNPIADLRTLGALTGALRRFGAETTLAYTAKPVIYGTLAARLAGVGRRCAMITGVGSALVARRGAGRLVAQMMRLLYATALRQAHVVLFQNPDDQRLFTELGLLGPGTEVRRIHGSGVDLAHFAPAPLPNAPGPIFLMIARLLRDKGVVEYVEAARDVRRTHPSARFLLLGGLDANPSAVTPGELQAWREEGTIEYLGTTDDVRPALASCHVCVLPSYGEGMPRSVLEAMAMGRPILTTDVAGCRETVEQGVNGLLVEARSVAALAEGMRALANAAGPTPGPLEEMGRASRALAERRFDVRAVNSVILRAMQLGS